MTTERQVYPGTAAAIIADAKARDAEAARVWDELREETRLPELAAAFSRACREFDPATGKWREPLAPKLAPAPTPGLLLNLGGKWRRLDKDDDRTSEPKAWDRRAEAVRQAQADRDFLDRCRTETGEAAGPKHEKQKRERAELLAQSHTLARRLESAGTPAYRKDGAGLWVFWVCSGEAEALPQFRRICFLPTVSAQVRAAKLAALEYFVSKNTFCRFWTFTSGPRVRLEHLRARVEWLHAKLNDLNQYLRKFWAVELLFRSTELGTVEFDQAGNATGDNAGRVEFDQDGSPLFHPHAHCVIQSLRGYRPPDQWKQVFTAVWDFWRDDEGNQLNWDGGRKGRPGVIRNPRECCKYVTKPGDMLKLLPVHLARTEAALHGLHLVQPLGALKREISERRKAGKVLVRVPTPDGTVWAERVDWNKFSPAFDYLDPTHKTDARPDRWAEENLRDARAMAAETVAASRVAPGTAPRDVRPSAPWARVFARLAPAVGPRGVKEPRVVVGGSLMDAAGNFTAFHRAAVDRHPLVARLWSQTVEHWEAGIAADKAAVFAAPWRGSGISVHTGTPTATAAPPDPAHDPAEAWETASPVQLLADFATS